MSKYMVRVELHKKSSEEGVPASAYTKLHAEMKKEGFGRTITGGDIKYELPPAEYRKVTASELDAKDIRDRAKAVIEGANLGRRYSILVARYDEAAWVGLDEA